jgi:hypothetical protein
LEISTAQKTFPFGEGGAEGDERGRGTGFQYQEIQCENVPAKYLPVALEGFVC